MRTTLVFLVATATAAGCGVTPPPSNPVDDTLPPEAVEAVKSGPTELLVELVDPSGGALTQAEGDLGADLLEARARDLDAAKQRLIAGFAPRDVAVRATLRYLPILHVEVGNLEALEALAGDPSVKRVHVNRTFTASLADSLPLIGQPAAAAAGATGAGTAVAVLDTGVDYRGAAFGACTAPGTPAGCKVAYAADFATNDNALDDNGHGTNVSAIVLGVAPSTKVIGLDVFRGGLAYSTDIIAAINWCIANKAQYNIVALNMSLGGGGATAPCGTDVFASAISAARTAGILSAVAAGNDGFTNQISSPACAPDAVSVGAVYDRAMGAIGWSTCSDSVTATDKVTCFSNSASFLTVLAPGALITAGGSTMGGTSQASPHVAGAIAALATAFPADAPTARLARLTSTGVKVVDARTGRSTPRINLAAASAPQSPADVTAPVGTIGIPGNPAFVGSTAVTLVLSATDAVGTTQMCLSNQTTCTAWRAYATSAAWTLAAPDGVKTVRAWFKDAAGNVSAPAAVNVSLDTAAPTGGALTASPGNNAVALSWAGFADAVSGIATYRVVAQPNTAPASCTTGTLVYSGAGLSATHAAVNGTTYGYRVCATDRVGNGSTGATATARPIPERDGPVGSVVVNAGAAYTKTLAVTLTLSATDASGVADVCLSNTTSCTAFVAYAPSKAWTLAAGDGVKTVFVRFRDVWGNVSAALASDTITLDTIAPAGGTLKATSAKGAVTLSWTGITDAGSSVARYTLVAGTTTAPATCATGTALYSGTATSFVRSGLTGTAAGTYRLCATDGAGNMSAGLVVTAAPLP